MYKKPTNCFDQSVPSMLSPRDSHARRPEIQPTNISIKVREILETL